MKPVHYYHRIRSTLGVLIVSIAAAPGLCAAARAGHRRRRSRRYRDTFQRAATRHAHRRDRHQRGANSREHRVVVPELLMQFPGIHVRDNSGSPNQQVDMRGFGIFGDQNTLILLDGQRISENEQTTVNWAAIPLSAIERIEIMRGSGAVLYGAGATGGTINIITKAPVQDRKSAYLGAGVGELQHVGHSGGLQHCRRERRPDRQRQPPGDGQLPRQQPIAPAGRAG